MRGPEVDDVAIGCHGDVPFVGSAAPIAAFWRSPDGGRTEPAPPSAATAAGAQRRTAGGGYFVSRCKAGRSGSPRGEPGGVSIRRRKIAADRRCGPGPLAVRSPSGGRGRSPFPARERSREPIRSTSWRASVALIVPSRPRPSTAGIGAHRPGQVARARPLEDDRSPDGGGLR